MLTYQSLYFDSPPQAGRALDIWVPDHAAPKEQALLFVHGGGWRLGSRHQMHDIMYAFYQRGYICIAIDYRLGEARIPQQLGDIREGMEIARGFLEKQGLHRPFVLYGSSAGGHLALLAGLAAPGACGDEPRETQATVCGIIASCAPVTFESWPNIFPGSWDSMQGAIGVPYHEAPELYQNVSPARYVSRDSPPLFFLLGECEHMFPNSITINLVEKLIDSGGRADYRVYPAAEHGFFYNLDRRSQQMAFEDILSFLEQR